MFNKIKEQIQLKKTINKISIPKGKVQLTYDYLKSLSKDLRAQEIAYHIMDFVLTKTNEDNIILMKEYSPGMKMVATTWHLQGEVNNGGFCQYFDNNENLYSKEILRDYYQITKDSLELLGSTKIKEAFVKHLLYLSPVNGNPIYAKIQMSSGIVWIIFITTMKKNCL